MILFSQLTLFRCRSASSPEPDVTDAFTERLTLDIVQQKTCIITDSNWDSRAGMITNYALLPARPHDIQFLETLLEEFEGCAPADKGFIDEFRHSILFDRHNILVVTPPRKNMKSTFPEHLVRFCRRIRKRVETVGSQLTGRFKADRIRTHDLWHFQHRLIRKILAHTVCVFINLSCNHPPLDLDGLVAV
jgi:hypothetical protein